MGLVGKKKSFFRPYEFLPAAEKRRAVLDPQVRGRKEILFGAFNFCPVPPVIWLVAAAWTRRGRHATMAVDWRSRYALKWLGGNDGWYGIY